MEPCKIQPVNKYHDLPRPTRRLFKKRAVSACLDCGRTFYVVREEWYASGECGFRFAWTATA